MGSARCLLLPSDKYRLFIGDLSLYISRGAQSSVYASGLELFSLPSFPLWPPARSQSRDVPAWHGLLGASRPYKENPALLPRGHSAGYCQPRG